MGNAQPFFSTPLVLEVPGSSGTVVFLRPSRAIATACVILALMLGAEAWVAALFLRSQIPSSTTASGTIAIWIALGVLGLLAAITLFFLGRGVAELFRYWTMTIDGTSRKVTVCQRTPFGRSIDTFGFGDIKQITLTRPASHMNYLVQLYARDRASIRLGMASRLRAETLAQRLASLTDAEVKEE